MRGLLILNLSQPEGEVRTWSKKVWCVWMNGKHVHVTAEDGLGRIEAVVTVELCDSPGHQLIEIPDNIAQLAEPNLRQYK